MMCSIYREDKCPSISGVEALLTVDQSSPFQYRLTSDTESTKQHQQDDNNAKPSGCPHLNLKHVPVLSLVGSMIPQHSGLPKFELGRQYENNSTIRERFGSVMTLGFPGFGVGWRGTLYYIFSPSEVRPTMMFPLILLFLLFVLFFLTY